MLFNSITFLWFLPIVFGTYWFIGGTQQDVRAASVRLWLQNLFIVVASYIFYGWWDWRFLILMSITSLWAWMSGLVIERYREYERICKTVIALALIVNLGILGVFKYYNFFVESFVVSYDFIFSTSVSLKTLNIILPVGISFYTFQALSYVIDVKRRDVEPTHDVVAFLSFVSFFPQLVAGPIERATNLLPQFLKRRHFDYALAVDGCRQMLWGYFKKMAVADGCAMAANNLLGQQNLSTIALVAGLFCFSMQIYGDFSGYTDIAIGLGKLFGIRLKQNFSFPYFSRNIAEFWRRWHISLTTWFKDYLYIPIGGSRGGLAKTIRNTFIVFIVLGFWHGASWTFIAWGALHAVAFLPLLLLKRNRKFVGACVAENRNIPTLSECWGMFSTFVIVMFGWLFFRAESLMQACHWISWLFVWHGSELTLRGSGAFHACILSAVMLVVEWFNRSREYGLSVYPQNRLLRYGAYFCVVLLIVWNLSPRQSFIYFQF